MEIELSDSQAEFIARKIRDGVYVDAGDAVRDALRHVEQQVPAGADIEALAFIVLMDAARSAEEDLKAIMAEVRAINAAKAAQRKIIDQLNRDVAANAGLVASGRPLDLSKGLGDEAAYHAARWPVPDVEAPRRVRFVTTDLWPGPLTTVEELAAIVGRAKDELDSLAELGELEALRLQQAMDRRSRFLTALSNAEKKLSDTASAIVQNLK